MLTLVMPDCFTASITDAKAPKGTFSSARDEDRLALGVAYLLLQLGADLIDVDRLVVEENALLAINGDYQAFLGDPFTVSVCGMATSMPDCKIGAVTMKIDQRHQHHVHQRRDGDLMSASDVWVRPRALMKAITAAPRFRPCADCRPGPARLR